MTLLPLSAASSEDPPLPALRLDETPDDKASLVLPPRTFNPSRVLRSLDTGPDRRYRLTRLLQRGMRLRARRIRRDELTDTKPRTMPRAMSRVHRHAEPPRRRNEPVPDPARRQSRRLASLGRRGAGARAPRRQADPAVDRLLGMSLVPRDGARVVRGSARRGGDERRLRQHQGRPRGAARSRPDLPDGACAHDAALGRLAADDVPDAGRRAVFRREPISRRRAATACRASSIFCRASPRPIASGAPTSPSRRRS